MTESTSAPRTMAGPGLPILAVLVLGSLGLVAVGTTVPAGATQRAAGVFEGPVPRAHCGPGSRPETAFQGEVTIADRKSGRSAQGYTCNLEQVGNYPGEGAQWQMAWYGHCAYYATKLAGTQERRGTIVVDVSDPATPRFSTNLTSLAMLDPWESLKVHQGRGLLAGVFTAGLEGAGYFDVYDVKGDCARPKLLASVLVNGLGHEGEWAADGMTYYASGTNGGNLTAIDVSDPKAPTRISSFFASPVTHGFGLSSDGERLYLAEVNEDYLPAGFLERGSVTDTNGLGIYDIGPIGDGAPVTSVRRIGKVSWKDGTIGQHAIPIRSKGRPYVVFVDEHGHGGTRIIDVSDETRPRVVSKLKLEIQMPEHKDLAYRETRTYRNENGGELPFGYNSHYCQVDRLAEPTILACSNFESGVRIFDIRDVLAPREIAYFNPGGDGRRRPGSSGGTTSGYTSAQPRIIAERGEVWFTDQDRGFYVVRFTNGAWPFPPAASP